MCPLYKKLILKSQINNFPLEEHAIIIGECANFKEILRTIKSSVSYDHDFICRR